MPPQERFANPPAVVIPFIESLDILYDTKQSLPAGSWPRCSLYYWAQFVKQKEGNGSIQHGKSEFSRPNGAGTRLRPGANGEDKGCPRS